MTIGLPADIMHDLLEGTVVYVIELVLKNLVETRVMKYSDIENCMVNFSYGSNDKKNKPLPIKTLRKSKLSGTASQKLCLLRTLPFIIGHKVPENSEVWQLFLLCREIVEICLSPVIKEEWLNYLKMIVNDQNELFKTFATNFPPKFHYLIHYASLIEKFGPLRNFWSMRYESKH